MLILVANLGSTSFKFRLFRFAEGGEGAARATGAPGYGEEELAKGGVERIGRADARTYVEWKGQKRESTGLVADHAAAIEACLGLLRNPAAGVLAAGEKLDGIGFKAVHGGDVTGAQLVTKKVIAALEEFAEVAPAHNPIYVEAMRLLQAKMPSVPLVVAFETGFHQTIPAARREYAVPRSWSKLGIRRYGFHGASHRYVAERMVQLQGRNNLSIISCHLGGSSSLCAIEDGKSIATSMGFSPQSGLPQGTRVGDLDVFALAYAVRKTGRPVKALFEELESRGGLAGLSGGESDVRELQRDAALERDEDARRALLVYVEAVRHYLGAYWAALNGARFLVFTGGIGENAPQLRAQICDRLDGLGIVLHPERNAMASGEGAIHLPESKVQIWVVPTNEEIIVARQTREVVAGASRN